MAADLHVEFGCAFCGEKIEPDGALGLTAFPAETPDEYVQWWVHPNCLKNRLTDSSKKCLPSSLSEKMGLDALPPIETKVKEERTPAAKLVENGRGVLVVDSFVSGKRYGIAFDLENGEEVVNVTELEVPPRNWRDVLVGSDDDPV